MSSGKVLKCSLCEEPAVTVVRYAKLRLCRKHFTEFICKRVLKAIERYRLVQKDWRILVAISGGKDSAALLHILTVLSKQLGFEVIALHNIWQQVVEVVAKGYGACSELNCSGVYQIPFH